MGTGLFPGAFSCISHPSFMSILLQILIIVTVFATFYALVVHNRPEFKKVVDILPDFTKLLPARHESAFVKVVVYVPDSHAELVRSAIAGAGGGIIGHYTACSFSSQGMGRYVPGQGARPLKGTMGQLEVAEEERLEFTVGRPYLQNVVMAIKKASPYEETIIDIYALEPLPGQEPIHSH